MSCKDNRKPKGETVTLQETKSIHDYMKSRKIELYLLNAWQICPS